MNEQRRVVAIEQGKGENVRGWAGRYSATSILCTIPLNIVEKFQSVFMNEKLRYREDERLSKDHTVS